MFKVKVVREFNVSEEIGKYFSLQNFFFLLNLKFVRKCYSISSPQMLHDCQLPTRVYYFVHK